MYIKNTTGQVIAFQGITATTGGILSGATWTVRRCIDGTFGAGGGTVTEDSTNGWYKYAMAQADTNGNDIQFNFTASLAVPQTVNIITTACNPTIATNFGITALPATPATTNASLLTSGAGTDQISVSSGRVINRGNVRKNTAFLKFGFMMTDSTNHNPVTGKTLTCTRDIMDGNGFVAGTLANVTEESVGIYRVDFGAGDLNADCIILRATAAGCDDTFERIITFI